MAMRLARSNDTWRALYKHTDRPIEQVTVTYKETPNGPDLTISLIAPISLFCGENGVGKSRALRALHQALGGELNDADFRPKIGPEVPTIVGVSATLRQVRDDGQIGEPFQVNDVTTLSKALRDTDGIPKIYWFDPTVQIPYLLHILRHDSSLSDLWEGVSPKKLSGPELGDLSALVGRTYSIIEFLEIGDYQGHEVVPYFRVTCNGETYGAEDMGLGELSLLFFYWMLSRIGFGSVLLLEEPETFVAPKSQRALIDLVANAAQEKGLFVAVTSHSGIIAERIPETHIDFVSRRGKEVIFLRKPPRNILVDRLALIPPRSLILLVEDEAAALFARALIEAGNSKYVSHCGVFIAGSDGEIAKVLNLVRPRDPKVVTIIGLFDGDQRDQLPKGVPWPTMCLPGKVPPELFAKQLLEEKDIDLERLLSKPKARILAAFGAVDGQNYHDWLVGFCASLQISMEELFRRVADGLLQTHSDFVSNFVAELESKANGVR